MNFWIMMLAAMCGYLGVIVFTAIIRTLFKIWISRQVKKSKKQ